MTQLQFIYVLPAVTRRRLGRGGFSLEVQPLAPADPLLRDRELNPRGMPHLNPYVKEIDLALTQQL